MPERKRRSIDIGCLGEDEFKRLCSLNGMIATKSTTDRLGWDFFVEIQPNSSQADPSDQQIGLQKSLFQVKSSRLDEKSVRGKLSAFKYLVDTELPAFVIHQMFDHEFKIKKVKILHIGKKQIELILSQIRKRQNEGHLDIHKHRISLSLNDAISIDIGQHSLLAAILEGLTHFSPIYGKAKMDFRAACGFDKNSISAVFSFPDGIKFEDLVDLMLGLKKTLPMSGMTVKKRRFGIALDIDNDKIQKGTMSVEVKPFQTGFVKAISLNGLHRSELVADLFTPNVPGLDPKDFRVRIKNDVFDAVMHLGGGQSKMLFVINDDQLFEIGHLSDILNFGTLLCEEGTKLYVDFPALHNKEIPIPEKFKEIWSLRLAAEFLTFVVSAQRKKSRHLELSACLKDVNNAIEANWNAFSTLARPGLKFSLEKPENLTDQIAKIGSIFIPIAMEFKEFTYQAIARANATWKDVANGMIEVTGQRPIVFFEDLVRSVDFKSERLNELGSKLSFSEGGGGSFRVALEIGTTIEGDNQS